MFQETIVQINNGAAVAELSDALEKVVAAVRADRQERLDHAHVEGGARFEGHQRRAAGRVAGEDETAGAGARHDDLLRHR